MCSSFPQLSGVASLRGGAELAERAVAGGQATVIAIRRQRAAQELTGKERARDSATRTLSLMIRDATAARRQ